MATVARRALGAVSLVMLLAGRQPAAAQPPLIYVDAAGTCDGNTPCYLTVQDGVNHADSMHGVVVIYPGLYAESVNLDLMGSAVGGMPDDITLLSTALLPLVNPASAPAAAAVASTGTPLDPAIAALASRASAAIAGLQQRLAGTLAAAAHSAQAAVAPVEIVPAAGPAIFHTGVFPGTVGIGALTLRAMGGAGLSLPDVEALTLVSVHADDNGGDGVAAGSREEITVLGATAHRNGGSGLSLMAAEGITMISVAADHNTVDGVRADAKETIGLASGPSVLPIDVGEFITTSASHNGQYGWTLTSAEDVTLVRGLFSLLQGPTIEANDNMATGLHIPSAGGNVTAFGIRANRNQQGIIVAASGQILMVGGSADANTADGADLFAIGMGTDFPVAGAAITVAGMTASRNAGSGFVLTAPNAGIVVQDVTAERNTLDGVQLAAIAAASPAQVIGSMLCDNAAGLRVLANVPVDATGNWWGSTTGPQHPTNPSGTGNPVIDGANGGSGTVTFIPFIDTIKTSVSGPLVVGSPTTIDFQFSGGNGTVFLGPIPPLSLFLPLELLTPPDPPFAISTDNGTLSELGPATFEAINQPNGIVRVRLVPARPGPATVTLNGPCELHAEVTVQIQRLRAPLLGLGPLAILIAMLALLGARTARRAHAG